MLYRLISASGAMTTPRGRKIFLAARNACKNLLEPNAAHLRSLVRPGAWIRDIGANVGYYSRRFVRLDSVIAELTRPAVSFVKVDVQGAEARVLEGAQEPG